MIESSWADYEKKFTDALQELRREFEISHMIFGDIDLDAHRDWEEKVCRNAELNAVLPLWKQDRKKLLLEMLDAGIVTMIVSCNEHMGEQFLGKILSHEMISELEEINVDVCGENGEFHTLVLDCPLFDRPIHVETGEKILHDKYWFTNLSLKPDPSIMIGLEP